METRRKLKEKLGSDGLVRKGDAKAVASRAAQLGGIVKVESKGSAHGAIGNIVRGGAHGMRYDAMVEGASLKSGNAMGAGGDTFHGFGDALTTGFSNSSGTIEGLGDAFNAFGEGVERDPDGADDSLGYLNEDSAHGRHEAMMSVSVGDVTRSAKIGMFHALATLRPQSKRTGKSVDNNGVCQQGKKGVGPGLGDAHGVVTELDFGQLLGIRKQRADVLQSALFVDKRPL
ncbi:unnamed protein product [Ilex paraguariensis]|uniref:Uncharacterized protein n=1 Tax=Ilex paraguariensis TaxID=185542 RepID=A0ABC8RH08_9AQUA